MKCLIFLMDLDCNQQHPSVESFCRYYPSVLPSIYSSLYPPFLSLWPLQTSLYHNDICIQMLSKQAPPPHPITSQSAESRYLGNHTLTHAHSGPVISLQYPSVSSTTGSCSRCPPFIHTFTHSCLNSSSVLSGVVRQSDGGLKGSR